MQHSACETRSSKKTLLSAQVRRASSGFVSWTETCEISDRLQAGHILGAFLA